MLVRRNADAGPIAETLAARGVPVEVVGLAGSLHLRSGTGDFDALRLVVDPTDGAAAMEVLTGPRWRLGVRDLAALWRRHGHRRAAPRRGVRPRQIVAAAAAPPTPPAWPTPSPIPGRLTPIRREGYRRITAIGAELARPAGCLAHPVNDLVTEVRRVLGVDAEVRAARPDGVPGSGTEHLDRFADVVVARYAERPGADAPDC